MRIIADDHIHYVREYFSDLADLQLMSGRTISAEDVKDADVLLVRSITRVDANLLKDSRVKWVGSVTTGTDHLDLHWLKQQGITVFTAEGFNVPPVADYVVSVIAALQYQQLFLSKTKKAAVIGVGRVGRLVVERLLLLGFDVILCDPLRAAAEPSFHSTLLHAVQGMDLITVHVPLTYHGDHPTFQFLNEAFFQRQNKDCVFINASRGAVVSTDVLLRASSHIQLCLDVFEHEPLVNPALLAASKIMTPHIAGYSVQSKCRGTDMIYRAMLEHGLVSKRLTPLNMPTQTLHFETETQDWRDWVLQVFDPLSMTQLMRKKLSESDDEVHIFDTLRNQFRSRHEFAYTGVEGVLRTEADKQIISGLSFLHR